MAVDDTGSSMPSTRARSGDREHLEAGLGTELAQEGDVAPALMAEVEVLADDHGAGAETPDQHLRDEVLGRLGGAGLVEVHDRGDVEPGGVQQLQLLVEVGELGRGRFRPHDEGRVLVEGDDRGPGVEVAGQAADLVDDRAVAEVDAVVGADRDDAAGVRGDARVEVAEHLHAG